MYVGKGGLARWFEILLELGIHLVWRVRTMVAAGSRGPRGPIEMVRVFEYRSKFLTYNDGIVDFDFAETSRTVYYNMDMKAIKRYIYRNVGRVRERFIKTTF